MSESMSEWIEIGKIVAPQGLKGEVRVYPNTDFPDRFLEPGQRWLLSPGESEPQPIELLQGRYLSNKGLYVVKIVVPGNSFFPGLREDWPHTKQCIRISLTATDEELATGMQRLAKVAEEVHKTVKVPVR